MSTDDAAFNYPGDPQIENDKDIIEKIDSKSDSKTSTLQLLAQLLGGNANDEVCTRSSRAETQKHHVSRRYLDLDM